MTVPRRIPDLADALARLEGRVRVLESLQSGKHEVREWTPAFTNVTLGTGGSVFGAYYRAGNLGAVIGGGFALGVGGVVTGPISVSLPFAMKAFSGANKSRYIVAGRAFDGGGTPGGFGGVGICDAAIDPLLAQNWITAGLAVWAATVPFTWGSGDIMDFLATGIVAV